VVFRLAGIFCGRNFEAGFCWQGFLVEGFSLQEFWWKEFGCRVFRCAGIFAVGRILRRQDFSGQDILLAGFLWSENFGCRNLVAGFWVAGSFGCRF